MKYRKLRIAWSAVWGIVCLLLVALWVRSYRAYDIVTHVKPGFVINTVGSNGGTLYVAHTTLPSNLRFAGPGWQFRSAGPPLGWRYGSAVVGEVPSMFEFKNGLIRLPYFLLIALSAAAVAVSWLPWQFSLRTLLIATTLVAVGLGWIVYELRN